MHLATLLLPTSLLLGALAAAHPQLVPRGTATSDGEASSCLSDAQATSIVGTFLFLLENPTSPDFASTAQALFTPDFIDESDSINELVGLPVRLALPELPRNSNPRPLVG